MAIPIQTPLALFSVVDQRVCLALLCQVDLTEDGEPPEWIMLVPAGDKDGLVHARDGRKFKNRKPQAVVDLFKAEGVDLPIDWNHAEEKKAPFGEPAPAAGWIDDMEVRAGAIWGHASWNTDGAETLKSKKSRYISPVFDKIKDVVHKIWSAGLVNSPALAMPAIARSTTRTEDTMDPKTLELLGLTADATPEQIAEAIAAMAAKADKPDPTVKLEEVTTELETTRVKLADTETELTNARNANPSLDKFVPRADHDAALARAKTLEDEKVETEKATHTTAVEVAITAALKTGKITPATKDFYVDTCSTKDGLEKFSAFVKGAPAIVDPSTLGDDPPPTPDATVNDEAFAVAAETFGMTREEYSKAQAEIRTANGAQQ
jgi:phage I-like protein